MTVGLQTGEQDVQEPEAKEKGGRGQSVPPRPAQLPSDVGPAPVQQHRDGQEGEDGEKSDGESQRTGLHYERLSFRLPVDGRHWPGHADAQEDVDSVTAGHIPDGGVCIGVLDRGNFTGKCVWGEKKQTHVSSV